MTQDLVRKHEALPCTGPNEPINFEIFSAGPEIAGLPMTAVSRRCDEASPDYESPANEITYIYGDCKVPVGSESGCTPPLEIQTWPACQRSKADYSFGGRPLPSKKLPEHGGAEVVEFDAPFLGGRIEVYTKESTVVIFAESPQLAREAVKRLTPQERGQTPARSQADLDQKPPQTLGSPASGAIEGELQCRS